MSTPAHIIDCDEALQYLYDLLDHELTPELEIRVRDHFETCKQCFPLYQFEQSFKRFLKARAHTDSAPEALRRRIFDQIMLEEDGTV